MAAPLDSCHVIDLSLLLPGPLATQILRDMGARVTKVEPPQRGDWLSKWPPMKGDQSVHYLALNRGKEVVSIDLKDSGQRARFEKWIETADVLVEGFRPGVMQRLGLDYERLSQINPRLVMCSLSGYGQTGPNSQQAGHDLNYLATAGVLSLAGGQFPRNPPIQVADTAGGAYAAAMLILAALLERTRSGRGRHLDVSMSEQLLPLMTMQFAATSADKQPPIQDGDVLTGGAPCYRIYKTRDGHSITLAALEPHFWRTAMENLGLEEWIDAPYFGGEGAEAIIEKLQDLFASKTLKEWVELLGTGDTCFEPVLNLSEVQQHPHWKQRESFVEVTAPDGTKLCVPKMPAALAGFETQESQSDTSSR